MKEYEKLKGSYGQCLSQLNSLKSYETNYYTLENELEETKRALL